MASPLVWGDQLTAQFTTLQNILTSTTTTDDEAHNLIDSAFIQLRDFIQTVSLNIDGFPAVETKHGPKLTPSPISTPTSLQTIQQTIATTPTIDLVSQAHAILQSQDLTTAFLDPRNSHHNFSLYQLHQLHQEQLDPQFEQYQVLLYILSHLQQRIIFQQSISSINTMVEILELNTLPKTDLEIQQFYLENRNFRCLCDLYQEKYNITYHEYQTLLKRVIFELYTRIQQSKLSQYLTTINTKMNVIIADLTQRDEKIKQKCQQFSTYLSELCSFIYKQSMPKFTLSLDTQINLPDDIDLDEFGVESTTKNDKNTRSPYSERNVLMQLLNPASSLSSDDPVSALDIPQCFAVFDRIIDPIISLTHFDAPFAQVFAHVDECVKLPCENPLQPQIHDNIDQPLVDMASQKGDERPLPSTAPQPTGSVLHTKEQLFALSTPTINISPLSAPLHRLATLFINLQRMSYPTLAIHVVSTREYLCDSQNVHSSPCFDPYSPVNGISPSTVFVNSNENMANMALYFDQFSLLVTVPTMITHSAADAPSIQQQNTDQKQMKQKKKKTLSSEIDYDTSLHFLFSFIPSLQTVLLFGFSTYHHITQTVCHQFTLPSVIINAPFQKIAVIANSSIETSTTTDNDSKSEEQDPTLNDQSMNNTDETITTRITPGQNDENSPESSSSSGKKSELTTNTPQTTNIIDMYYNTYGIDLEATGPVISSLVLTHSYPWLQSLCGINNCLSGTDQYVITNDIISSPSPSQTGKTRINLFSLLQRLITTTLSTYWFYIDLSSLVSISLEMPHNTTKSKQNEDSISHYPLIATNGFQLPINPTNTTISTDNDKNVNTLKQMQQSLLQQVAALIPAQIDQQVSEAGNSLELYEFIAGNHDLSLLHSSNIILNASLTPSSLLIKQMQTYLSFVLRGIVQFNDKKWKQASKHGKRVNIASIKVSVPTVQTYSTDVFNIVTSCIIEGKQCDLSPFSFTKHKQQESSLSDDSSAPITIQQDQNIEKHQHLYNIAPNQQLYSQQNFFSISIPLKRPNSNITAVIFLATPTTPFTLPQYRIPIMSILVATISVHNPHQYIYQPEIEDYIISHMYSMYGISVQSLAQNKAHLYHNNFSTPLGVVLSLSSHTISPVYTILSLFIKCLSKSPQSLVEPTDALAAFSPIKKRHE